MIISGKITEAIEICCEMHKDQHRKASSIPFASHPVSVGFILLSAGFSEEIVIAGILHDTLEDTKYSEKELRDTFGDKVHSLVVGVTEKQNISSWDKKKNAYLENLKNMSNEVKAVSAADLLDNTRSMLRFLERNIDIWKSFSVPPIQIVNYKKERLKIIKEGGENEITKDIELKIQALEKYLNR